MPKSLFYFLFIGIFIVSCSSQSAEKRKIRISSSTGIPLGAKLDVAVQGIKEADSVNVFLNEKRVEFTRNDSILSIDQFFIVSNYKLQIKAYFASEKIVSNRKTIRVYGNRAPKILEYKILAEYSHNRDSYTQGLKVVNNHFYESAGLYGESDIRIVDVKSGEVKKKIELDDDVFAEGLTVFSDSVFQLTWQGNKGFIYSKDSLKYIDEFHYNHEGWGIDADSLNLYVSDGSSRIRVWDPKTCKTKSSFLVRDDQKEYDRINELEVVGNFIWANVYQEDLILKIDKNTGMVNAKLYLLGLLPNTERSADTDVLNGIAYNSVNHSFYITGKKWPKLYELQVLGE